MSPSCFQNCVKLEYVDLGRTTRINSGAFKNCYELKTITCEVTVDISSYAFMSCVSLVNISMKIRSIGGSTFRFCTKLMNIDISHCNSIDEYAFSGCESLNMTSTIFGDSYSFSACNLIKSVVIKGNIYSGFMYKCHNLEAVTINDANSIGENAFAQCEKLKSITFLSNIKSIGSNAFAYTDLSDVVLNLSSLQSIGDHAFYKSKVKIIKLDKNFSNPNSDSSQFPFQDVTSIDTVYICASFGSISNLGFYDSPSIKFIIDESNPYLKLEDDVFIYYNYSIELAYYMPSNLRKQFIIPINVEIIDKYAFSGAINLEEIIINHGISGLQYAFAKCKSIKSINFDYEIQSGNDPSTNYFCYQCSNLEYVKLPNKLTTLNENAFAHCINLKTIEFDAPNLHSVGKEAFMDTRIEEMVLNSDCLSIGEFSKCKKLKKLTIVKATSFLKHFSMPEQLEDELVPDEINLIYGSLDIFNSYQIPDAFLNDSSISEIFIPNIFSKIGDYSFGFTNLKKFELQSKIQYIESTSFYGSEEIVIIECNNRWFKVLEHEIIERESNMLVLTFGKLMSTYILPREIKAIGDRSIISVPKYDDETGKVIDFGITTLIIPGMVDAEGNPFLMCPYLTNVCYGGTFMPKNLDGDQIDRIFVTENLMNTRWRKKINMYDYTIIEMFMLREKCDTSVPFENLANYKSGYSSNPNYIPYPKLNKSEHYCPPEIEEECDDEEEENHESISTISSSSITSLSESSSRTSEYVDIIDDKNEKQTTSLVIALIIIAVIEIIVISGLIVMIVLAYKDNEESSPIEMVEETAHIAISTEAGLTYDNPLFQPKSKAEKIHLPRTLKKNQIKKLFIIFILIVEPIKLLFYYSAK
ncbi:surface antigen BspA-like [Trichomonas vaginalis G3]|uniref:Surface antigen BspA-like n=1 Tax=Trichomonas vaginalis (strain ATCC PRA-98 / G3) TaxID=412133 RepID=A2E4H6_TRIV3|nr:leucine-rich repeats (6 copies)-containing protein [Trichomonas vaginalis G3]EAY12398.1 surface antigen BspA-like [Trichomonas vaginalis G3]KAI5494161.1 leucine-rich repeats (6 copies)-containing protein [Trichomonas vaginalis G3]|eukprot:XP_001324621.1 surface antigen BspA-like [Trichomonas vaginalis G3]